MPIHGHNTHHLPKTVNHGGPDGGRGIPQCFQQHGVGASSASQQEPPSENIQSTDKGKALAFLPTEATVEETPMKRKIQGGQEGKSEKTFEAPNPIVGPYKRKAVCDLCNMCCPSEKHLDQTKEGKKLTPSTMIGAEKSFF
ncbi:hypothetical protein COLO4_16109 [Corchorus olitorius]|uniref:Uncharacterized protein n=1 Tax=Corchorus olitorius TaxID=93759 RepID=A0A1R3JJM3_9ROSI|nr:hypothetical protein COLO4_16109 [Corchorus olitorius]